MEIDSDGEKVDLKDRETYEGLFKEYWDIIKEKEGLTLEDLHHADVQIKKGKITWSYHPNNDENIKAKYQHIDSESKEYSNNNENKRSASDSHDSNDGFQPIISRTKKRLKKLQKKCKGSQKIDFLGWGSRSLIEFLKSIRVDTNKKLSQYDVASIVKKYVQDKKLFNPEKKEVLCDLPLRSLLGRTTFNVYKIDDLLEPHFIENVVKLDDDNDNDDDDGGFSIAFKKENAMFEEGIREESVVKVQHSIFASIVLKNMKLIYLKRCLVEELMKYNDSFESKVIGSFVKVKSDQVNVKYPYQLLPIIGIREHSGDENNRKILLRISTLTNEVPICLLSNDDLSEEDCENLQQKMGDGLLKRLTVVEVEEKAKSLHEDITKHWISRELSILRHRIDLANEKGRRFELFEYRRKRELLQSEEEQSRLLKEVPQVIANVTGIKPTCEPSPKPIPELVHITASDTDESQDNADFGTVVCGLESIENDRGKRYSPLLPHNLRDCVKAYCPHCDKQEEVEESSENTNFKYEETYAGLFKACHDIIKEKESLTLEDLHYLDALIKTGKNVSSHYNKKDENLNPKNQNLNKRCTSNNHDNNNGSLQPRITKRRKKLQKKCKGSKRIEFLGWGSKSLIEFLGSIKVDTNKKHSQDDVASLIYDYVHDQNLFHPEKKKVVLCDMHLRSLLGRTTFNLGKIIDLLEPHFFENIEQSKDKDEDEDEEEEDDSLNLACEGEKVSPSAKKQKFQFQPNIALSEEGKRKECGVQVRYSSFATINIRNMNLVYLKRCLVENLMKQNLDFEEKVVGSFVKIKSASVDAKYPYHFLPVTGINKASRDDNGGRIFLRISTLPNEVPICLLSNNNLSQEDCDYLQQKVKDGLLEKPTVVELEHKAKSLHEDMTKHWIDRELSSLRHRIDLANEKGRRAELFEYRRRREMLQSQEQSRLLKEVPQIIADVIEIPSETDTEHASKLAPNSE